MQAIRLKTMGKIRRWSCPRESGAVPGRQTRLKVSHTRQNGGGRKYIEFHLDPKTFKMVEAIARQEGQSPFEVCVSLLREQLSR
jgi:hypothetical protein